MKTGVKDIAIGGCFGAAIDVNNLVWTWGSNASGELGVGDYEPRVNPFPIVALQGKTVTKLSCGGSFAMALGVDVNA
jgi:X-linked retinitis pigmentosa GTPase regulator